MLKKNVKLMIDNGDAKCKLDYELAGKVLDNFLIIAEEDNLDVEEEGFDKFLVFTLGNSSEFRARLYAKKQVCVFAITYSREVDTPSQKRMNSVLPKDKRKIEEAKKEIKKEAKKKDDKK